MTATQKLDPAEDLSFGGNAPYIDLTHAGIWDGAIAGEIGKPAFARVNAFVAARAGHTCEFCGAGEGVKGRFGKGAKKFVIEPRFRYDEKTGVATLMRVIFACASCSKAIHLRQTQLESSRMPADRSPYVAAVARLVDFSGGRKTPDAINGDLRKALEQWDRFNSTISQFDIGIVERFVAQSQ